MSTDVTCFLHLDSLRLIKLIEGTGTWNTARTNAIQHRPPEPIDIAGPQDQAEFAADFETSFPRRYSRHMYHPYPVRIYSWTPQLWCHRMAIIPRIKGGALSCNFFSFMYRKTTNPSIYWVWRLPITFKPFPKTAGAPHWIRSLCSWRQRFCILHGAFFSS